MPWLAASIAYVLICSVATFNWGIVVAVIVAAAAVVPIGIAWLGVTIPGCSILHCWLVPWCKVVDTWLAAFSLVAVLS